MPGPHAIIVGRSDHRLWGLAAEERYTRLLARHGIAGLSRDTAEAPPAPSYILLKSGYALDPQIIAALATTTGILLRADDGGLAAGHVMAPDLERARRAMAAEQPVAAPDGLRLVDPVSLCTSYNQTLRKKEVPFAVRLTAENRRQVERRMFQGSYKGVTDLVTKYVWPRPAFWVTKAAARLRLTPNLVTFVSLLFVIGAYFEFAAGRYFTGLIMAWTMTFLDTVDGKLARVTVTSSKWGNVFDHGIDLIHPPFWYAAWGFGLAAPASPFVHGQVVQHMDLMLAVIIGGYVLGRIIEGVFIWVYKMELHVWRPIDSGFRLITARRNPNILLLTASLAMGRPDAGLAAVALWTVLSILFHLLRVGAAALSYRRHGALVSWLSQ